MKCEFSYRVIVIDPHDALKDDLREMPQQAVFDFLTIETSINLFQASPAISNNDLEILLELFQNLIGKTYNSRLERVLRFGSYLLLTTQNFSFFALRRLLLDLEYRQQILNQAADILPDHITHFFQTEFGELKNKFYSETIAPIVAIIDEMQMVSFFNQDNRHLASIEDIIKENFLTTFSLNRSQLGGKVTKTIASLLFGNIFSLAEQRKISSQLILIIDEVAVVEMPILQRFLSEMRKYHVSVYLAGQFFSQITPELQSAIFANTANYFLFRTARADADLLVKNIEFKLVGEKNQEDRVNFLSKLSARECLVRISRQEKIYPIFHARTMDLVQTADQEKLLHQKNSQKKPQTHPTEKVNPRNRPEETINTQNLPPKIIDPQKRSTKSDLEQINFAINVAASPAHYTTKADLEQIDFAMPIGSPTPLTDTSQNAGKICERKLSSAELDDERGKE